MTVYFFCSESIDLFPPFFKGNHGDEAEKKVRETKKKMSRKKRHAPTPPVLNSLSMEEDLERTSSTSSPTSHDSGIEEGKPRSRDSSTSNRLENLS